MLSIWQFPTVVYVDNLDPTVEQRFATANLHFYRRPLDMSTSRRRMRLGDSQRWPRHAGGDAAGRQACVSVAVVFLEQVLLALRAQEHGYGELANPADAESLETQFRKMFVSARYAESASRFAAKYADYNAVDAVNELANRLETMASM